MVKISNACNENEIHRADGTFNKEFQKYNFFAREAQSLEEGRPENLQKMAKNREPIVMQIREWSILIGNTGLYSLASKSLHYFGFLAC